MYSSILKLPRYQIFKYLWFPALISLLLIPVAQFNQLLFHTLELTESMLVDDIPRTITILNSLRDLNITLAIDDFGTGYSSLNYLKQFPIDILKIDQSFTRDISIDNNDKAIVGAIIALAHQLGMTSLAEGVETLEHQQYLQQQGCEHAQGYLYCKPLPASQLMNWWQQFEQQKDV